MDKEKLRDILNNLLQVCDEEYEKLNPVKVINQAITSILELEKKEVEELQNTIDAIEKEVSEVYCYITNGRLSKPTYLASVMKAEIDDMLTDAVEEATKELEKADLPLDQIEKHYDEFLGYYYNSSCAGCKDGHPSFWKTIVESLEWKAWEATRPPYDFAECEELGIMGKKHFEDFVSFIKKQAFELEGKEIVDLKAKALKVEDDCIMCPHKKALMKQDEEIAENYEYAHKKLFEKIEEIVELRKEIAELKERINDLAKDKSKMSVYIIDLAAERDGYKDEIEKQAVEIEQVEFERDRYKEAMEKIETDVSWGDHHDRADYEQQLKAIWKIAKRLEYVMNKDKVLIDAKERDAFNRLWHTYHAKHKIPYSYDERDKIFNSIYLIFREDK